MAVMFRVARHLEVVNVLGLGGLEYHAEVAGGEVLPIAMEKVSE